MDFDDANRRWYAVQVSLRHEVIVAHHLTQLGIEQYLPTIVATRPTQKRRREHADPLFPGYVFAHLDLSRGPRLYNVPGVVRILGFHGKPEPLHDEEITSIRMIVNSSLRVKPSPCFRRGDPVLVCEGPLAGVRGTFLRSAEGGTFLVALPLLQRSLEVKLPCDSLTPSCLEP